LEKNLPSVYEEDSLTSKLADMSDSISEATNGIIIGNLVLNIFLSASL